MHLTKLHKTYILSFLFALHVALSAYVNSSFLTSILSEKYVGFLFVGGSLLSLVFLSQSPKFLSYLGNKTLTLYFIGINIVSLGAMITSHNPILVGIGFVLFNTTNTLFFFCIDIFVEHFGNKNTIGKTHGIYLMIYNIAWLISPAMTSIMIESGNGYTTIYEVALVTATLVMALFIVWVPSFRDKTYHKVPFIEAYKFIRTKGHLFAVNMINFILQFFFAVMVVYTPIYLIKHIGFDWSQLGIIFTAMLIPFAVLGYPIGILIDRYHFHKTHMIRFGVILMGLSTAAIAYIGGTNIALWAIVLFCTRFGAAIVEDVSEMYFFTHVLEEDAHLLSIFRDMTPLAYCIAPALGSLFIMNFPFKYLFIVLSVIVFASLYYIPKLRHSPDELHLSH